MNLAIHLAKNYKLAVDRKPIYVEAPDVSENPAFGKPEELIYRDDVVYDTYYTWKSRGFYGTVVALWYSRS